MFGIAHKLAAAPMDYTISQEACKRYTSAHGAPAVRLKPKALGTRFSSLIFKGSQTWAVSQGTSSRMCPLVPISWPQTRQVEVRVAFLLCFRAKEMNCVVQIPRYAIGVGQMPGGGLHAQATPLSLSENGLYYTYSPILIADASRGRMRSYLRGLVATQV